MQVEVIGEETRSLVCEGKCSPNVKEWDEGVHAKGMIVHTPHTRDGRRLIGIADPDSGNIIRPHLAEVWKCVMCGQERIYG